MRRRLTHRGYPVTEPCSIPRCDGGCPSVGCDGTAGESPRRVKKRSAGTRSENCRTCAEQLAAAMGVHLQGRAYGSLLADVALNMRDAKIMLEMSHALGRIAKEIGMPLPPKEGSAARDIARAVRSTISEMRQRIIRLDVLSRSVDELDLSVRSANCLQNAGIKTIGGLTKMTKADVQGIRWSDARVARDVAKALAEFGLSLAAPAAPATSWASSRRPNQR